MNMTSATTTPSLHPLDPAQADDGLNETAGTGRGIAKTSPPSRKSHLRKSAIRVGAALMCAVTVMTLASAASAATGVQNAGLTGNVLEAGVPARCYNSGNGYFVTAVGPSVYGFAGSGYADYAARLYDATTGTYGAWSNFSSWNRVSATSGVNFSNMNMLLNGSHSHYQYVQIAVRWTDASSGQIIGLKLYYVSSYLTPYGMASYCYN